MGMILLVVIQSIILKKKHCQRNTGDDIHNQDIKYSKRVHRIHSPT